MTKTLVGTPDPEDDGPGPPPKHQKLSRSRPSRTFEFRLADTKGYVTVGEYPDGRPAELFIRLSKLGSTLTGILDAFGIAVSAGLQRGIPLGAYVEQFTNSRFEPAGMTDDPELRFASSVLDYTFRRLAVDYLSQQERAELGILTAGERIDPRSQLRMQIPDRRVSKPESSVDEPQQGRLPGTWSPTSPTSQPQSQDAPYCMQCGVQMQRAGSCFACPSCGSTSGCS